MTATIDIDVVLEKIQNFIEIRRFHFCQSLDSGPNFRFRIRMDDFFKDFDPLRSFHCTCARQFAIN